MDSSATPVDDEDIHLESETSGGGRKRNAHPGASAATSLPVPIKTLQPRSGVWMHFTRTVADRNKCRCHYCGRSYSCNSSSGTSNLMKHLRSCKQYIVWDAQQSKQQAITPDGHLKLAKVSEAVFREATNELLIMCEFPLAITESLGWRHFCNKINLYSPHSRRTATRDVMEMFVTKKEAMKKVFKNSKQRVSLTTDIWVAPSTGASYMVITAHFIDEGWNLKKLIIGFKNVGDHKGDSIASVLLQCLEDWGITKVFTITVDNASANTVALRKFRDAFNRTGGLILNGEFLHMRCAAHILNLVVKDGLHEATKSVVAIRNAITYVRASSQRLLSFEQKVESGQNVSRGSLSLDCKTRWNSTYLMLTRALKFKSAFDKMEAEDKLYNDHFLQVDRDGNSMAGPPSSDDWQEIDRLVQFLHVFYQSTLVVSASSSLNAHNCYVEICTIENNLIRLSHSNDMDLQSKAAAMRAKFDKYWGGLMEINRLIIIASVFDPTKKMQFAELCFDKLYGKGSAVGKEIHKSVMSVMQRLFDEYQSVNVSPGSSQLQTSSSQTSHSRSQPQTSNVLESAGIEIEGYERLEWFFKEIVSEKGLHDASDELALYLKEPVENPNLMMGLEYDVLGWWRLNTRKFPILSKVARDVLALQVSSVASESAFSTSGRIVDPSRSCLTHATLEALMCTQQWLKCEIHMNEKGVISTTDFLGDIEFQDKVTKELGL